MTENGSSNVSSITCIRTTRIASHGCTVIEIFGNEMSHEPAKNVTNYKLTTKREIHVSLQIHMDRKNIRVCN
jgi:hypothetical protein